MPSWLVHEVFAEIPECAAHVPLSVAFAQFIAVECDADPFDQEELRVELQAPSCVQETMRWFVRQLQTREIRAIGRPLGGGPLKEIALEHWHADDVAERFVSSRYSRANPFEPSAKADTWLFIPEADFSRLWEETRTRIIGPLKNDAKPRAPRTEQAAGVINSEGQLLSLPAVELMVGLRRSTIYKLMGQERFPPQVKIGGRSLWRRKDIDTWIEQLTGDLTA